MNMARRPAPVSEEPIPLALHQWTGIDAAVTSSDASEVHAAVKPSAAAAPLGSRTSASKLLPAAAVAVEALYVAASPSDTEGIRASAAAAAASAAAAAAASAAAAAAAASAAAAAAASASGNGIKPLITLRA